MTDADPLALDDGACVAEQDADVVPVTLGLASDVLKLYTDYKANCLV